MNKGKGKNPKRLNHTGAGEELFFYFLFIFLRHLVNGNLVPNTTLYSSRTPRKQINNQN